MRPVAVVLLGCFLFQCPGQQKIPGLGTDPLRKRNDVPVVKDRIEPPSDHAATGLEASHARTLEQLQMLIDEASALRDALRTDGAGKVRADSGKRIASMRRSLKAVESGLKAR